MSKSIYRGRIFYPRPDAVLLAEDARRLAMAHREGRLVVPLGDDIRDQRRSLMLTLAMLRKATASPTTRALEAYRTELLQDLSRIRRQLAALEAARDLFLAALPAGFATERRCPVCHRAQRVRHNVFLAHESGSLVCSGSAAIIKP